MRNSVDHQAVENAIEAQKRAKLKSVGITTLVVFFVIAILGVYSGHTRLVAVVGIAYAVLFAKDFLRPKRNESEYYALPFSRDEFGNHTCVFCGNTGIYRHGEYGKSTKYVDCSQCGKNLWVE